MSYQRENKWWLCNLSDLLKGTWRNELKTGITCDVLLVIMLCLDC